MPKTETSPSRNANKSETSLSQYTKPIKADSSPRPDSSPTALVPGILVNCRAKAKIFAKEESEKNPKNPNHLKSHPLYMPIYIHSMTRL